MPWGDFFDPEDDVLPASNRPPRFYEPARTHSPTTARSAPVRDPEVVDDNPTILVSGVHPSILPPRPDSPVPEPDMAKAPPTPNLRGGTRIPESQRGTIVSRSDEEDRTILRPLPADFLARRSPILAAGSFENRDAVASRRASERARDAGDPPSAVATARLRVVRATSRQSAAAALVAVGAFVGLIISVIARGDATGIVEATANMITPARAVAASVNSAGARFAVQPVVAEAAPRHAAGGDRGPAGACLLDGEQVPPTVAPVVISAPARTGPFPRSAPAAEPPASLHPSSSAANVWAAGHASAKSEGPSRASGPAAGGAAGSHPAKSGKSSGSAEFESAAAADALAKAQLEASLR